jgi:hypothetical protein
MAKRTTKKRSKKTATRSRQGDLSGVSTSALAREIKRREKQLDKLGARRDALLAQVVELETEMATLADLLGVASPAGRTAGGGRKRAKNDHNLADSLVGVLNGVTMGVTEAAEAVQKAGYKTTAANFRTIVNQTLIRDKRIKKVSRGQYTAK